MGERYWFPLALLGFGLLAVLGRDSVAAQMELDWHTPSTLGNSVLVGVSLPSDHQVAPVSAMRDWTWAALIAATLVLTVAWYAWRARREGGPVRTTWHWHWRAGWPSPRVTSWPGWPGRSPTR